MLRSWVFAAWSLSVAGLQPSSATVPRRAWLAGGLTGAGAFSSAWLPAPPAADAAAAEPPPGLKLSRADLSQKLTGIPVFYCSSASDGVAVGPGDDASRLFFDARDAEEAAKALGSDVSATQLSEVWFPLVRKSAKLSVFPPNSVVGKVRLLIVTHSASSHRVQLYSHLVVASRRFEMGPETPTGPSFSWDPHGSSKTPS